MEREVEKNICCSTPLYYLYYIHTKQMCITAIILCILFLFAILLLYYSAIRTLRLFSRFSVQLRERRGREPLENVIDPSFECQSVLKSVSHSTTTTTKY